MAKSAQFKVCLLFSFLFSTAIFPAAAQTVNGGSSELAYYSASQALLFDGNFTSGLYWFDEAQGLGSPFISYANQSTDGGGWTVALVSLDSAPTSIDISSNVGTASAPFSSSFSRDVRYLAQDQLAQIFYDIREAGTSNVVYQGYYTGRFDDLDPNFSNTLAGTPIAGLDAAYDFHAANNYDLMIMVREQENTPALRTVPEPSAFSLLGLAAVGVLFNRRRF